MATVLAAVSAGQAEITDGLIAYWNFDDNVQDQHNGHHGSLVGDPFYTAGKTGLEKAIDFDGAGDYVETSKTAGQLGIGGNAAKTVTAWVYTRSFNNGGIFEMGEETNGRDFSLRTLTTDNNWRTQFWGGSFDIDFSFDTKNKWVHFAVVHTGSTVTIYANGAVAAQQSRTLDTADTKPFRVGRWRTSYFDGLIDEVAVWGRALTAGEVSLLYNGGVGQPLLSQTVGEVTETDGSTLVWEKGETTDSFDVVLIDQPAGDVTVTATPTDNGSDIELIGSIGPGQPIALVFTPANWNFPQTITVKALDDEVPETLEVAKIEFLVTAGDPNFNDGQIEAVEVTVIDFNGSGCPEGDLSGNCIVGWEDILLLASQWLDPNCFGFDCADLTGGDGVNMVDYVLLVNNLGQQMSPLLINEFMASNSTSLLDGNGNSSDWVEVVNVTGRTFNLDGWYLTDNPTNLTKWAFHGGKVLAPGEFLVVFASGQPTDTYVDPGGYLHTSFKLKADTEYVALVRPDGVTIVSEYGTGGVNYPKQVTDISYGLFDGEIRYFALPTPGAPNDGSFVDFVADTKFSVDRGFYDAPFAVAIKTDTLGAEIYYTLDGSEPIPNDGILYSGPIDFNSTTTLRAAAFKSGWQPTDVDAHTYIFLDQVITQTRPAGYPEIWGDGETGDYDMDPDVVNNVPLTDRHGLAFDVKDALLAIPTMSLVMDKDDLFDLNPNGGIYVHSRLSGIAWERPGSVELIYPDGTKGIQVNCGVRIYGGVGRYEQFKKHTFRFLFKGIYGPTKLRFPLFDGNAVEEFDTIIIRAGFNNTWHRGSSSEELRAQYLRDEWIRQSQLDMGRLGLHGTFVHLYVNGMYWGLYNPVERCNADFGTSYIGGQKEEYDALNSYPRKVVDGNAAAWLAAQSIADSGVADQASYDALAQYVDIGNLIDYMLLNFYSGNIDWDDHNWYSVRRRLPGAGWKFISWDSERTLESITGTNQTGMNRSNKPSRLYSKLRENPEFRIQFADHAHKHMFNGGVLTPSKNRARYKKLSDFIDRAIVAESARWGDMRRSIPYTREVEWITERDRLLDQYFPQRTDVALGFLRGAQLYPNIDAPVFNQHGGDVPTGFSLTMTNPNTGGTMYYTLDGEDPRLPVMVVGGGLTTLLAEDAAKTVLIPSSDIGTDWQGGNEPYGDSGWTDFSFVSGMTGGVGYDDNTNYNPYISYDVTSAMDGVRTTCYIRIPFVVDPNTLAGMNSLTLKIRYDDGFLAFINGTKLTAEANPPTTTPDWQSKSNGTHSDSAAVNFQSYDISSNISALQVGDNILAIHGLNTSITSSDFLISVELIASDEVTSGGISPSAIEYTAAVSLTESRNVKARVLDGSIWSALNEATFAVGSVDENLRITEIMYHPANDPVGDPNAEYIELQNVGAESINLNLVRFSNGIDFTFGDLTLNVDDYVVVVHNQAAFDNEYPTFSGVIAGEFPETRLANNGERIRLADALDITIQDFRYKDSWRSITDGEGFSLTIIDPSSTDPNMWDQRQGWRASAYLKGSPGADDSGIVPNPGAIVINEVLAHSDTIVYDFIELYNTTTGDIDLDGWFLSDENTNQTKYEITTGDTVILAGGYKVFYEDLHFGTPGDAGVNTPFALSENGEKVVLRSGQGGLLTGYRNAEVFGPSAPDISLGRYQKSTGTFNFVAMSFNTPDAANADPKVGPVVISEIMYHPAGNGDAEYIELVNISKSTVTLYDAVKLTGWRMTDGIDYDFPAAPVTLDPNEVLLLVKNLAAFISEFPTTPVSVQKFEWSSGSLSNGGERVQLAIPGDLELGVRQYIRIDRVTYDDKAPWPTTPDGLGKSLTRTVLSDYGNDPANWQAATPTPGL